MSFTESAPSSLAPLIDTKKVSANLSQLNAVELGWALPKLPDMVKLDLATYGGEKENLTSFLYGLEQDLKGNEGDESQGFSVLPVHDGRSASQELQNQWSGWANIKPPQQVDQDAVSIFKADAVAKGFLPADTPIDSRWDPAYSSVQHKMIQDDVNARYGGTRPGAISWQSVAKTFDDWGSPSGLLRAAVDLDFFPDFARAGKELSGWGDKVRAIGKAKNPFDFGAKLIDALTGPVDDIVVPLLNDFLLFTGIGEAAAFGRLAIAARRGLKLEEAASGLYATGRMAKMAVKAEGEFEAFQKAGLLGKSISRVSPKFGGMMAAWRRLPEVSMGKKLVQTTMKVGLLSRVEDNLPGYQGGIDAPDSWQQNVDDFTRNPAVWMVGESLFTPSTVFGHGAFSRLTKKAGSALIAVSEHTVAPVASAGASTLEALHLRNLSRKLSVLDFKRITEVEELTAVRHEVRLDYLKTHAPERVAEYEKIVKEQGVIGGLSWETGLSQEQLGAAMSWDTLMAGIDTTAAGVADGAGLARGTTKWEDSSKLYRNKMIAQIRKWNPDDRQSLLIAAARADGGDAKKIGKRFEELMADVTIDDAKLSEMAATHNAAADAYRTTYLAHATPDVLRKYLPQTQATFGDWPRFVETQQNLHESLGAGLLSDARYKGMDLETGLGDSDLLPLEPSAAGDPFEGSSIMPVSVPPGDYVTRGSHGPLARVIEPSKGRFTSMRKEQLTKLDVRNRAKEVRRALGAHKAFEELTRTADRGAILSGVDRTLAETGLHLGTAKPEVVTNLINDAVKAEGKNRKITGKSLDVIRSYMRENGVTFDQVGEHLKVKLSDLEHNDDWGKTFEFETQVTKDGKPLYGVDALQRRYEQLNFKERYTAAEIDVDDLIAKATAKHGAGSEQVEALTAMQRKFEEEGYKLVHGVEFASPIDLMDRGMPFSARGGVDGLYPDITQRHLNGVRLGNFAKAHEDAPWYRELNSRTMRKDIAEEINALAADTKRRRLDLPGHETTKMIQPKWMDDKGVINMDSPDLRKIVDDVFDRIVRPAQETAAESRLQMAGAGWGSRLLHRASTVTEPHFLSDVGLNYSRDRIMIALTPTYGEHGAAAIWRGIKRSRVRPFADVGLATMEQRLRSNPIAVSALKTMSGLDHPNVTRLSGAMVGGAVGASYAGDEDTNTRIGAAVVGGIAGGLAGRTVAKGLGKVTGAKKLADVLEHSARWNRYAYLADEVMQWRDVFRFSLSPVFDASRYTEGVTFGQLEDIGLRINQTPTALRHTWAKEFRASGADKVAAKAMANEKWAKHVSIFRNAAKGDHDFDSIDYAQRWFSQVGILGYDTTNQMASTFTQLHAAGWAPQEAYAKAHAIYNYGLHGRSALNQSINTVFFPFSFQAKQLKGLAKFVSKDWSRAVMMHDAYKTYQLLDEEFDLNKFFRNQMPVLQRLQQLNLFNYGLSAGILGGINRPFIEVGLGSAEIIKNFFAPQAVQLGPDLSGNKLVALMKKALPAYSNVDLALQDLKDQGHVLFGPSHQIASAEATDGFQEWSAYKASVQDALVAKGYKWNDIYNKPELAPLADLVLKKRGDLEHKYPGWSAAKERSLHNQEAIASEMNERRAMYRSGQPLDPESDESFMRFDNLVAHLDEYMRRNNLSTRDDMEKLPLELIDSYRAMATKYASAAGEAGKGFLREYKKYWLKRFGPLTRNV